MPLSIQYELVEHAEGRFSRMEEAIQKKNFLVIYFMNNQFCQKPDKIQTTCEARDLPSRKKY